MSAPNFVPYNPRRFHLSLLLASLAAIALIAWAVRGVTTGSEPTGAIRAGVGMGFLLAFASIGFRLRPREGWGVRIQPSALTVSGPLKGERMIPWSDVRMVERLGKKRDTLVIFLKSDVRVLVPRHLFDSARTFETLASAIEDRAPSPRYDA
jgi:hypothetical protein